MEDSEPLEPHRSHKGLFILLGAGVLLLAGAGAVLFMRGHDTAPPEPEQLRVAAQPNSDIPAPLMAPKNKVPQASLGNDSASSTIAPEEVTEKKPIVMGTIDPKVVARFIDERFVLIKSCYERRLKNNPMLQGKIDVNIGISPNGSVNSVRKNNDSVQDPEMWGCIKKTIRKWRFPAPQGGPVEVAKMFRFKKMD